MGRRRLFWMGTREAFLEMLGVKQWSIDPALLWHRTAYESLVVFLDLLGHEHLPELGGDLGGLGQENQACGRAIQSMDRVEELLQLVAERLQEDRFALKSFRPAMDHQAGGLEHRDQMLIAVNHLDWTAQALDDKVGGVSHAQRLLFSRGLAKISHGIVVSRDFGWIVQTCSRPQGTSVTESSYVLRTCFRIFENSNSRKFNDSRCVQPADSTPN